MTTPVSAEDVRAVRRVLSEWTLERYTAVRDEQRSKGAAPRELLILKHNMTLADALSTLSDKGVLSAPIVDAYTGDYIGARKRAHAVASANTRARERERDSARSRMRRQSASQANKRAFLTPPHLGAGFLSMGDILKWLLKGLYPSLLDPELRTAAAMSDFLASAPPNLTNMAAWARSGFLTEHIVRPGEDGDIVYKCVRVRV